MANVTTPSLKELMAAGAHFGHKRERSHPKAKQYIYVLREGIYIIDLQKTQEALEKALKTVADLASRGKTIMFVGTKPQAADLVKTAAEQAGMPYIVNHWPGGLLTNFETVQQNLKQLATMEAKLASDDSASMTKKEKRVMSDKVTKTTETLGGVRNMRNLPDALFVVDVVAESTAVGEAYRLGIPVIGICDTNANPEKIDFPIPANDDARKAIELITGLVAQAISGNKAVAPKPASTPATEEKAEEKTEVAAEEKPAKKTRTKKTEETEAAAA